MCVGSCTSCIVALSLGFSRLIRNLQTRLASPDLRVVCPGIGDQKPTEMCSPLLQEHEDGQAAALRGSRGQYGLQLTALFDSSQRRRRYACHHLVDWKRAKAIKTAVSDRKGQSGGKILARWLSASSFVAVRHVSCAIITVA